MTSCTITYTSHGLVLKTPYDPGLVAALKANIPATDRKFDPTVKAWVVAPNHGQLLTQLVQTYFGESIQLPRITTQTQKETRLLEVKYLGQCKQRDTGEVTAFGWVNGEWSAIFSEQVLRDWFEAGPAPVQAPDQATTLYAVLGVSKTASVDEIKSAFRKMARQWHPDVCREPNAAEMFIRIKEASDILSDPKRKARYDAGLALEASLDKKRSRHTQYQTGYRAPLRCGWVMCEGTEVIGRFVVSKILAWEDVVRGNQVLVSSWPMGATEPVEQWV